MSGWYSGEEGGEREGHWERCHNGVSTRHRGGPDGVGILLLISVIVAGSKVLGEVGLTGQSGRGLDSDWTGHGGSWLQTAEP